MRSRATVADFAARGVQVREADYSEPDSMRAALAGVNRLLLVSSSEAGQRVVHHTNVIDAAVAGAIFAASRSVRLGGVFLRLQDTTAKLRVRAAVALLIGFVVLAQRVGLETILGAFMAGVIVAALDPDTTTHPRFRAKLEGIGYGFVVPVSL